MKKDFMLNSRMARFLYRCAKELPIIDYHNHLSLDDIRENKRYSNIYELWIEPDPYKHRAMRMCGVEEKYITGDASDEEKFQKWSETLPKLIGNPLYHWSEMELDMVFGVKEALSSSNWSRIYSYCNTYLEKNVVSAQSLMDKFNVEYICPCAGLTEDVSDFIDNDRVAPSLRGDDMINVTPEFVERLSAITGENITDFTLFKKMISKRLEEFKKVGCCFSDHALDNGFMFLKDDGENESRFKRVLSGTITEKDREKLSSHILKFVCEEYARLGFVLQLHIGAQRYTSTRLRKMVGPAGGYAAIGNSVDIKALTEFLDEVEKNPDGLPRTILFTLNPVDNAMLSTLSGSYSKDGEAGLITQGPAWWWCDHKQGMEEMLENTAVFGTLSNFIGMTTDSRSFLSFIRHDYFRRTICSWIGEKVAKGEYPNDRETLKELITKMCYSNAKDAVKER